MPCECCAAFRDNDHFRQGSPSCVFCGARLIQIAQRFPLTKAEKSKRSRALLDDWLSFGHSEEEIRKLAKGGKPALEPR